MRGWELGVRVALALSLGLLPACSAVTNFDRSKIPANDAGMDAGIDAGTDAGTDAGVDAGMDGGLDGGLDAGMDAGLDAGMDAGVDAGNPCDLVDCAGFDDGCNVGVCNRATGDCERMPREQGTECTDGDACTEDDVCDGAGTCAGVAVDCDDGVACTTDTCDEGTGACTHLADLELGTPNVTSLSFVPVDLNQPDGTEILVAATDDGSVYQLDPTTGASTLIGSYGTTGNGQLIRSSGDIVAVRGLGILATVTVGDTLTDPDYLALIDPADWHATLLGSGASYDKIFGVGFWRDTIYGFVDLGAGAGGAIIALDRVTGGATLVNQGTVRWYGAGVTTNAPVVD